MSPSLELAKGCKCSAKQDDLESGVKHELILVFRPAAKGGWLPCSIPAQSDYPRMWSNIRVASKEEIRVFHSHSEQDEIVMADKAFVWQ